MFAFNQTKMNQLLDTGTVVVFTSLIGGNVTSNNINDRKCQGDSNNETLYNRTYDVVGPNVIVCTWNSSSKKRVMLANVSYMEASIAHINDSPNDEMVLRGRLYFSEEPDGTLYYPHSATPTGASTSEPPASFPTPAPTDYDPCSGKPLFEPPHFDRSDYVRYYFEPNRMWYVSIHGSPMEYAYASSKTKFKQYADRLNYKVFITDEYGGPTQYPTLTPTFGDTPVYVPSDMILEPYKEPMYNLLYVSFTLTGTGMIMFAVTRGYFNYIEKRKVGRWII